MNLNTFFTDKQAIKSALIGTILADGSISKQRTPNGRSSCEITHTNKNLDYLQFKKQLFELLPDTKCTIKAHNKVSKDKTYLLYRLATNRTDWLTQLRNDLYKVDNNHRIKIVPKNYINQFTELTFLLMYLDDGCLRIKYNKKGIPSQFRITLCLESFSLQELISITDKFNEIFGVNFHIYRHYKYEDRPEYGYRPWVSTKDTLKIMEKLDKYYELIPSMQYKFPKYYLL